MIMDFAGLGRERLAFYESIGDAFTRSIFHDCPQEFLNSRTLHECTHSGEHRVQYNNIGFWF